ncbi:MAG: hypothetical protein M3Y56_01925 [Armatimonadota bacterium]|nr:hypothetical protein [Armatimonadota bacterium]
MSNSSNNKTASMLEAGAAEPGTFSDGQLNPPSGSGNQGAPVDGTVTSPSGALNQAGGIPSDPNASKRDSKKRNPAILYPLTAAGIGAGLILIGDAQQLSGSTQALSSTSTPLITSTQNGSQQVDSPALPQPVPEPAFYQLGSLFVMGGFYFGKRRIGRSYKKQSAG